MKKILTIISLIILQYLMLAQEVKNTLIRGADLSSAQQIENNGGVWKLNGVTKDVLEIFKQCGANYVRLRLWHAPSNGYCGLDSTAIYAKKIKATGFHFLLDIHYSDTWADPGQQTKPSGWLNISVNDLNDSVYSYTKNVITFLKNQNTLPEIVQIGNEVTNGMLWPDGSIGDSAGWNNFTSLLKSCIRGVKDVDTTIKIMIHIDKGGNNQISRWFFDNLTSRGVNFDEIGLSYYPWYSDNGTLAQLQFNVDDLASRYNKDIIIVETAYPWTLASYDSETNLVGDSASLSPGYPATVEGQKNFIHKIIDIISSVSNNRGLGFFYWEPEWISVSKLGSPWENVTLFDFTGNSLGSISIFDSTISGLLSQDKPSKSFFLYQNFPNPFNPQTIIKYDIPNASIVTIKLYDLLGREINTLVHEIKSAGIYQYIFNASNLAGGIYFYRIVAGKFSQTKKMVLLK